jgi:hypothetical protein
MYFVLSFELVMSDTSADPTDRLHENNPAISLDTKSSGNVFATAITICDIKSAIDEETKRGFLPNLSDNLPKRGDTKNCIKEKTDIYIVTKNGPAPSILAWKGKTAIRIELKATTSRKTYNNKIFISLS